jgi:hypothetical protein
VGHAGPNCFFVSQVNQAAAEDDAGAKTETDGCRAVAEINTSGPTRFFVGTAQKVWLLSKNEERQGVIVQELRYSS